MNLADQTNPKSSAALEAWLTAHNGDVRRQRDLQRVGELRWSWARLVSFLASVSIWYPLRADALIAVAAAGVCLGLFAWAVVRHLRARAGREFADRLLTMIDESLRRCGGEVTLIRSGERPADRSQITANETAEPLGRVIDWGQTWALSDQECDDLDLYAAPVGVFGLLNRTSTAQGAQRLRDMIENPCLQNERILSRQACVQWLDEHAEERLRLMAGIAVLRDQDRWLKAFITAVQTAQPLPWPVRATILRFWALLSGCFMAFALVQAAMDGSGWGRAFIAVGVINIMLFGSMHRVLKAYLKPWQDVSTVSRACLSALRQARDDLPDDTELSTLRDACSAVAQRGVLPLLCRRLDWTNTGGMMHVILNVLVFYDLHVAAAILRRVVPNRDTLLAGVSALAELEALTSLAAFASEQPVRCYPTPVDEPLLTIVKGNHPLIDPDRVVPNNVELGRGGRLWIITGSNMSGKSTFLRMVGVNVLLAQLGTVACAEEFVWTPLRLLTDLRIRDDLSKDESYFMSEVRQLRRMIVPELDGVPILGLIDEPFRGTNSDERVAASIAVVCQLIDSPGLFFVATHERRLTELANDTDAVNRHFREDLGSDGAVFDYHLRAGRAEARNALKILEREGYPRAVIARARELLEGSSYEA